MYNSDCHTCREYATLRDIYKFSVSGCYPCNKCIRRNVGNQFDDYYVPRKSYTEEFPRHHV